MAVSSRSYSASPAVYTDRWAAVRSRPASIVPVRISLGGPRFIRGAAAFPAITELMPVGALFNLDGAEFERRFRERLDAIGVDAIQARLDELHADYGDRPLVLCCFEDVTKPGGACHRETFSAWWRDRTGAVILDLQRVDPGDPHGGPHAPPGPLPGALPGDRAPSFPITPETGQRRTGSALGDKPRGAAMGTPKMERTSTPGIYKRGSRYVVVWRHRGKQHKSFHRTLAEAREAKGQRQGGDRKPATRAALEDYAREWLDGYQGRTARGFTEQSRSDYRRALEQYAIPFFAGWRLADVEPPDVRRLVRHLEDRGLAPASVVKNLTPLKALFATAVEDGLLRSNPTTGVRVNRRRDESEEEEQAKSMTRTELARVMAELPQDWRLFFELLAKTGLRISEALGLDWPDLELGSRPVLHVRRQFYRGTLKRLKSRNGRRDLPLPPSLARALWAARPAPGQGPMFRTSAGTRYADRNVRRVLDAAGNRADVEWVHFHTFRHTCASMLFEGGKNIKQVCDWLGHADPAFTLRTYVHLMDEGLGDAGFLDAAVGDAWATEHPEKAVTDDAAAAPARTAERGA